MTAKKTPTPIPTLAEVATAFYEARVKAGYGPNVDGSVDTDAELDAIFDAVKDLRADSSTDGAAVAKTKFQITAEVYPDAASPDNNPQLTSLEDAVWKKLVAYAWSKLNPRPGGYVQSRIREELANGWVLCQIKVHRSGMAATPGVYLCSGKGKDGAQAIMSDLLVPYNVKLEGARKATEDVHAMVMERQPQNAKAVAKDLNVAIKSGADTSRERMKAILSAQAMPDSAEN